MSQRGPLHVRWLLLLLFPIGWFTTSEYWQDLLPQFTLLMFLATVGCALLLRRLRGQWWYEVHLWVILFVFLVAYFIKLFVIVHLYEVGQLEAIVPPEFASFFSDPLLLIQACQIATCALLAFCIAGFLALRNTRRQAGAVAVESMLDVSHSLTRSRFFVLLGMCVCTSVVTMIVEIITGIGVVGADAALPFHLAGVVVTTRNLVLPAIAFELIWLADRAEDSVCSNLAAAFLLFNSLTSALVSTSKAPALFAVLGLVVVWLLGRSMTRVRWGILLIGPPALAIFNALLSAARALRGTEQLGVFESVPIVLTSVFSGSALSSEFGGFMLTLVSRFTGIDALTYVVAYQPPDALSWTSWVLFSSGSQMSELYAELVLRLTLQGTAFSPSLLGELYLLNGSLWFVVLGMLGFVLLWQVLCQHITRLHALAAPALLASTCLVVAQMTSEGGLQALPSLLVELAAAGVICEAAARCVQSGVGVLWRGVQPAAGSAE